MKIRVSIDIKVGRLVKYFILSDLFFLGGWGFIDPILSVFVVQQIPGATLETVGIGVAIYWACRSVFQIPIANYLDRTAGEQDDFRALVSGLILAGITAFAFGFIQTTWQLYMVQAIHGFAFALYFASWPTIFSRHLDKDRISFDWSLDSTVVGLSAGVTGFLGGIVAYKFGYGVVFVAAGILAFIAALVLLGAPDLILPKPSRVPAPILEHKEEADV